MHNIIEDDKIIRNVIVYSKAKIKFVFSYCSSKVGREVVLFSSTLCSLIQIKMKLVLLIKNNVFKNDTVLKCTGLLGAKLRPENILFRY